MMEPEERKNGKLFPENEASHCLFESIPLKNHYLSLLFKEDTWSLQVFWHATTTVMNQDFKYSIQTSWVGIKQEE